jgi:hypothetical protein
MEKWQFSFHMTFPYSPVAMKEHRERRTHYVSYFLFFFWDVIQTLVDVSTKSDTMREKRENERGSIRLVYFF